MAAKKKRALVTYKTYFHRGQDPIVGEVLHYITSDGDVEKAGGPKRATIKRWRDKKTKRPQVTTLQAALGAFKKTLTVADK